MTCSEAQSLISTLLDEELPEDARVSLEAHLAVCPECLRVYGWCYQNCFC